MSGITNHTAQVAAPGQSEITIRAVGGDIELGQENDTEWRAIYVRPDYTLRLIRAMLVMIGMEDAKLYRDSGGNEYFGSGEDIEWPADSVGSAEAEEKNVDLAEPQPKDPTNAERQRRYRERRRNAVTPELPLRSTADRNSHQELVG